MLWLDDHVETALHLTTIVVRFQRFNAERVIEVARGSVMQIALPRVDPSVVALASVVALKTIHLLLHDELPHIAVLAR